MSLPAIPTFKIRTLEASTTSSGAAGNTGNTVPFRGKYLYTIANFNGNAVSQTAAGAINLLVNGSTGTADAFVTNPFISVTTSTGNFGNPGFSSITNNNVTLILQQGDVLATQGSSMTPYALTHFIQEF